MLCLLYTLQVLFFTTRWILCTAAVLQIRHPWTSLTMHTAIVISFPTAMTVAGPFVKSLSCSLLKVKQPLRLPPKSKAARFGIWQGILRVTASNVKRVPKRENTERLNAFVHLEAKFHGKLRHKIRAQIWGNCTSSMFKKYRYISVAVRGASQHCASLAVSQPRWHLWRWCSTWNKMPNSHRVLVFDTGREIWCQICAWWSCALPKW